MRGPGHLFIAGFSAAFSIMGSVKSQGNVSHFRQFLGMKPRGLFFGSTKWVAYNNSGVFFLSIEIFGRYIFPTTLILTLFLKFTFSTSTFLLGGGGAAAKDGAAALMLKAAANALLPLPLI